MKKIQSNTVIKDSIHTNNAGLKFRILKRFVFNKRGVCTVEFLESRHVKDSLLSNICAGKIRDPYGISIYGVGCLGKPGKYFMEDYHVWNNMLERCYSKNSKFVNWAGCTVSGRWKCFEYFLEDFRSMDNYGLPNMHLDKDLLEVGNKHYSRETCQLVHMNLNSSHGEFTGYWQAERNGTVLKTTFSAEMSKLIDVKKSTIRAAAKNNSTTRNGWKISKVA